MQRSPLQIVSVDILVQAEPKTCDGWACIPLLQSAISRVARARVEPSFIYLTGGLNTATLWPPVRVIRDSEIVENGDLNPRLRKELQADDWALIRGISLLFRAEEVRDSEVAREAYTLVSPLLFGNPSTAQDRDAVRLAISLNSLPSNIGLDLDKLTSFALANARLVHWEHWKWATAQRDAKRAMQKRRAIGIYCSDYRTAIAAKMILGCIRVCFRCHKPFIAKRPKQNCCKAGCREAYRLARWRAKKKSERHLQQKATSITVPKTKRL
jgi:hypothetical protein